MKHRIFSKSTLDRTTSMVTIWLTHKHQYWVQILGQPNLTQCCTLPMLCKSFLGDCCGIAKMGLANSLNASV